MAEHNPPVWMQAGQYQASDDRIIGGLLVDRTVTTAGALVGIEGGVVPPFDQLKVSAPGSTMTFTVSSGIAIVPAASASPPGAYICYNDGSYTGTLATEASGNPRIDLVTASVSDQATGGATSSWKITVIKGNPGVNPVTPAWTSNQIPLASIKVIPAAQNGGVNKITTAQITDLRNFVSSNGGVHLHWGAAPLPAHSPGRLLYDATQTKDGSFYVNDGTKYDPVYTYSEWQSYFAAYRPLDVSNTTRVQCKTRDVWDSTPTIVSTPTTSISPIQRTDVYTPSGLIKVTLNAVGRVTEVGSSGRASITIFATATGSSTAPIFPATAARAIHFYSTGWDSQSTTFAVHGLPVSTALTVRIEFLMGDNDTGTALFQNTYMMIDPVI